MSWSRKYIRSWMATLVRTFELPKMEFWPWKEECVCLMLRIWEDWSWNKHIAQLTLCIRAVPRCIGLSRRIIGGLVWRGISQNLYQDVSYANKWRWNIINLLEPFSFCLFRNGSGNTSPWTSLSIYPIIGLVTVPFGWLWTDLPNRYIFLLS